MLIEREFEIVRVEASGERVILTLAIIEKTPRPERVIKPKFETEEAKIGFEIGAAMVQGMAQASGLPAPMGPPIPGRISTPIRRTVTLDLSKTEYEKIGEPTINKILTLKIEVSVKGINRNE